MHIQMHLSWVYHDTSVVKPIWLCACRRQGSVEYVHDKFICMWFGKCFLYADEMHADAHTNEFVMGVSRHVRGKAYMVVRV
jgi:hypothetical protein